MRHPAAMTVAGADGKAGLVVAVAGPTCSGKSALAMALAERLGGVVINADSMQVYRELRILTARPSEAEERAVPHRLYGVRAAADAGSVAWWRDEAAAAIGAAHAAGLVPILCGGTGLYFAALTDGLADIPDPGEAARSEARALLLSEGAPALYRRLQTADPESAAGLHPGDSQRVARAWEVWRGTGRGMAEWQAQQAQQAQEGQAKGETARHWAWRAVMLDPPRDALRRAIGLRFAGMVQAGALDEVRDLLSLGLDPALPAMRAHGVPELSAVVRGTLTLDAACCRACMATGQYTKRQATWFRRRHIAAEPHTHRLNARMDDREKLSSAVKGFLNIL